MEELGWLYRAAPCQTSKNALESERVFILVEKQSIAMEYIAYASLQPTQQGATEPELAGNLPPGTVLWDTPPSAPAA